MLIEIGPSPMRRPLRNSDGVSSVAARGVLILEFDDRRLGHAFEEQHRLPSPPSPDASGSTTPSANETAIRGIDNVSAARKHGASGFGCERMRGHDHRTDDDVTAGFTSGCSAII
jgi:hypothetical protein